MQIKGIEGLTDDDTEADNENDHLIIEEDDNN